MFSFFRCHPAIAKESYNHPPRTAYPAHTRRRLMWPMIEFSHVKEGTAPTPARRRYSDPRLSLLLSFLFLPAGFACNGCNGLLCIRKMSILPTSFETDIIISQLPAIYPGMGMRGGRVISRVGIHTYLRFPSFPLTLTAYINIGAR